LDKVKTEVLYGIHPVFEALSAGRREIRQIFHVKDNSPHGRLKDVVLLAEKLNIPVKKIMQKELETFTGTKQHQNIGASVSRYPLVDLEGIIRKENKKSEDGFLLLLDNIIDPHNLGALVRTALCVGINGIIITKDRSAAPTPAVSKVSAGALEHVYMACVTNMVQAIKMLKKEGYWIAGTDIKAKTSLFSSSLTGPLAIAIGGEEKGLRPLVKKNCDFLVSIPQSVMINSLNASASGAVVMYEAFRQRQFIITKKGSNL